MTEGRYTKAKIRKLIYLTVEDGVYIVHHDIPGEWVKCSTAIKAIGDKIVLELRERQFFIIREQYRKSKERKGTFDPQPEPAPEPREPWVIPIDNYRGKK